MGYFMAVRCEGGVWPDGTIADTSPAASPGNSGRHSGWGTMFGVFHMVARSLWEIYRLGDRDSTQNFDTNRVSIVVWPGEPF